MKKLYFIMCITLLMMSYVSAKVHVHNNCEKTIYAKVHFIGAGSPGKFTVRPGKDKEKILLGIKKGYDVWINTGKESDIWDSKGKKTEKAKLKSGLWKKIISRHGVADAGLNVHVRVFQHTNPKDGEILYGLTH